MRLLPVILCAACLSAGCGNGGGMSTPTPVSPPVAVSPSGPAQGASLANWQGDATVVARSGSGGCGWGTAIGESRAGVLWRVAIDSAAVTLDEDMANFPTDDVRYVGTLSGQSFAATSSQQIGGVCQFAGGELSGTFSPDFTSFEAMETLRWGGPGAETTVQRRWQARQR
jgi:hypothetical protein